MTIMMMMMTMMSLALSDILNLNNIYLFFSKHENCCGVTPKAIHAGIPGADRTGVSQEKQAL